MQSTPLKLSVLALGLSLILQSCGSATYVQSAPPPPPVYSQAPPPPPPTYVEQQPAPPPAYSQAQEAPPPPVSYQSFYNELSPYGQWINTPDYGYVWVPSAGPDFQPYASNGYWALTNYGWTWVSNYSWGWAPFHYGTWDFDGTIGWFWIPGYQWSPAWVSWRSSPGYYGWAPLGPTYVNQGYAAYNPPPQNYVFVSATYMNNPNVATYYQPREQNATYYGNSTVVTNTYYDRSSNNTYYAGPPITEVERYTGTPIHQMNVVQTASPEKAGVSSNEIQIFRPSVIKPDNNSGTMPAPERVYQKSDVTPVAQRPVLTRPNQPRVAPFKPENNIQSGRQQRPFVQQQDPVQPQHTAPAPEQQHSAAQQAPTPQQHAAMQPQQGQQAQHGQGQQSQKQKQNKAKQGKTQPKPQQGQGQQPQKQ